MRMAFLFTQKYKRAAVIGLALMAASVGFLPAQASAASQGSVIISEFMANPAVVSDANGEWIEIKNTTGVAVSLKNWDIDGSTITGVYGDLFLAPRAHAVICKNAARAQNDGVVCDATSGFSLGNISDTVQLRDETNTVMHSVTYGEGVTVEGKSTYASSLSSETTKKYSPNNFGRPAHNQTTPSEPRGEIRVHHAIDTNQNMWPDFNAGEPHYKGRTVRLYSMNAGSWTLQDSVETTGKYYAESAKFVVDPGSYALCEVSANGFNQSFARTIIGWYNAPSTGISNASGSSDEYPQCIPVHVSSAEYSSHVFGDSIQSSTN